MSPVHGDRDEGGAMSEFRRYDHVEQLDSPDTDGIDVGTVHVFPKLDGTNGSVWAGTPGTISCGSRNRVLTIDSDNHGFLAWAINQPALFSVLRSRPGWILYGEWMVPHTLKTYRDEAWRRFWIFDVFDVETVRYLSFDEYAPWLRAAGLDLVEPLCVAENPTREQLETKVATNTYLIADGAGVGEGIVLKNYAWRNKFGRQPWAKLVRNEFKEDSRRAFGTPVLGEAFQVEVAIAEEHCTPALVGKVRGKIVAALAAEHGLDLMEPNTQRLVEHDHRGKVIPRLLETAYHDVVTECTWDAIKRHRDPTVNFKALRKHCFRLTKTYAEDLFR
jgi:hypothetical protein